MSLLDYGVELKTKPLGEKAKEELEKIRKVEQVTDLLKRREIEAQVFTPKDIKVRFKEKKIRYYDYVKVYFKDKRYYELFLKHFKISEFIEPNTHHIEPLIFFLLLLEKGIIKMKETKSSVIFEIGGKIYEFKKNEF